MHLLVEYNLFVLLPAALFFFKRDVHVKLKTAILQIRNWISEQHM